MGSRGVLLFRGTLSGHTRVEAKPRFLQRNATLNGVPTFSCWRDHLICIMLLVLLGWRCLRVAGLDGCRQTSGEDCSSGESETATENLENRVARSPDCGTVSAESEFVVLLRGFLNETIDSFGRNAIFSLSLSLI